MQWNYTVLKITNHLFSQSAQKQKQCHWAARTSVWFISCSEALCNKNCVDKKCEMLMSWSVYCYTAESDKPGCNERVIRTTAETAAMVFRVHDRHVEWISVDLPMIIINQHWSRILKKLCSVIERSA